MSLNCQADELTEEAVAGGGAGGGKTNMRTAQRQQQRAQMERRVGGRKREGDNGGQIMSIFAFLK